eukprot:NODE_6741_length_252_cov_32.709360_g6658_i0.p5 GENE.NODE_6741_length_252_cov_32.709360_g6658_i0~~NODE_6741_length_252_cov_32.709360_g6658_i0.p5  ORF type:complete len:52 (+),score=3.89 NODE_6741_length_252_cov_32.709360_g6658_i0:64-219(+)
MSHGREDLLTQAQRSCAQTLPRARILAYTPLSSSRLAMARLCEPRRFLANL